MRAQPKKSPAFPSIEQVRDRVIVKPKAFNVDAERKASKSAATEYAKWLGGLANDAIARVGSQRTTAQSVADAKAPVVLHIPENERGLAVTAYLFSKGESANAAFCGALASAISERLTKLGSNDFVGVEVEPTGASVTVRISDTPVPRIMPPKAPEGVRGDTCLGDVSLAVPKYASTIEACLAALEEHMALPAHKRGFKLSESSEKFLDGNARVPRELAFHFVVHALTTVREIPAIERPIFLSNGDIQSAISALQVAARRQA